MGDFFDSPYTTRGTLSWTHQILFNTVHQCFFALSVFLYMYTCSWVFTVRRYAERGTAMANRPSVYTKATIISESGQDRTNVTIEDITHRKQQK